MEIIASTTEVVLVVLIVLGQKPELKQGSMLKVISTVN